MAVTTHYGCFLPSDTLWVLKFRQKKHSSWSKKHTGNRGGLNRTDIVEYTRSHGGGTDLPRKTVREALDFVIAQITQTLLDGEPAKLTGFGTFKVRKRADRRGRNPQTGESLLIKEHRAVVFHPTRNFWK